MLETSSRDNDIQVDHKTDRDMKMVCLEKSDLNDIKSFESVGIDIKLDSKEVKDHSCSQVNSDIENEKRNVSKISDGKKSVISKISKDTKSRCGVPFPSKSTYYYKNVKHTVPKRKLQPVVPHLTNASAKVVLFERNVEIKDLESKVKYLQSKIQKLENENKTLHNVQSRQEKELKMFKEGVADIPSLLRAHKEETKVYETALSNIRRELRDCQKDLKVKNEVLLKKESHVDKLNVTLKWHEKNVRDISCELKELKAEKMHFQDENKTLLEANANLKSANEDLQKKIKNMAHQVLSLEEDMNQEKIEKKQLKEDLDTLRKKYQDMQLKVSSAEDAVTSENFVKCSPEEEISCNDLLEDDVKCSSILSSNLLEDFKEEVQENGRCADKSKEVSVLALKRYQDLCSAKFSDCIAKDYRTGNRNLKFLPPLKQSCKNYSQNGDKECCPPPSNERTKNGSKQWFSEALENYFQTRMKPNEASHRVENEVLIMEDALIKYENSDFSGT